LQTYKKRAPERQLRLVRYIRCGGDCNAFASGRVDAAGGASHLPVMSVSRCQLYLITPPVLDDLEDFARWLEQALDAGPVAALQIRLKPADDAAITAAVRRLAPLAQGRGVAVILNDRPDLAAVLGCDGVHVGQSDASVASARRLMGNTAMIGATCHDSRHLAMEAAEAGADYVAFGAFYPTPTKATEHRPVPELLTIWQETMEIPSVAIGGITVDNARPLIDAGADFLAVSGGVWSHPDGPAAAVRAFNSLFVQAP
jgi:thiamine-phosphate pyrophosphorylase